MTHEQLINIAKRLIAIQSTADNPAGLQEAVGVIAALLEGQPGITIERFERNNTPSLLAYYGDSRPQRFDVLLNGHVDVVPAKPEQFMPRLDNNNLYGRGGYDMKVAALVMTDLFREIGGASPLKIGLQIVSDEEIGGFDGARLQLEQGVTADFAVIGEMTNLGICTETRGLCWVEIAFDGTEAHGGYLWHGNNAIVKASDFAQAILTKFPVPAHEQWATTANIAAITTSNDTYNKVPGQATVKIDFRFIPEDELFVSKESITSFFRRIDPTARIVDFAVYDPGVRIDITNPYLQHLAGAFRQANGESAQLIRRYAASDARNLAAHGIPCAEFGLSGGHHHSDQEYIDLRSVTPFRETLRRFLMTRPRQMPADTITDLFAPPATTNYPVVPVLATGVQ
jgi:succinyl-diaminopimelate desuccinylase